MSDKKHFYRHRYKRGNDMQANGTARERKGIEIRKCIYSRMKLKISIGYAGQRGSRGVSRNF